MGTGYLTVKASMANEVYPIEGAVVVIQDANRNTLYTLTTDASGRTRRVKLSAPDKETTLDQNYSGIPYSTYIVRVSYPGFVTEIIEGVQIFDTVEALQLVEMRPLLDSEPTEHVTVIPPHVQVSGGQPQQEGPPESEPISALSGLQQPQVMIPETITVHLGSYTNASARNVIVPFPLYIKNVASSEIYPTWPEASLEANIRAIINFALNRVYTEWYRIRGFNFDITSTTATDQYFVEGRDIFVNIGVKVDQIIGEYLRRPNHIEPFFTSFCDGKVSQCSGLLQWGTVDLANNGYSPMQIIHYYYPNDLFIDTAPIGPIVESFPGVSLSQGIQGPDVELMQRYLNRIRQNYPLIPYISNPNGIFGTDTANSVRVFQQVFSLPQTGVIDRATWNKISYIYVAVTKLASLNSEGDRIITSNIPPSTVISLGVSGGLVARLQYLLTYISQFYPDIPSLVRDGAFGSGTRNAVIAFQQRFGLTPDGVVGPATWNKLYEVYFGIDDAIPSPPAYITHIVQPGDTLFQLAQQFGTTVAAIMELNNLTSDILTIGQVLRIPSEEAVEPPVPYITHIVEAGDTLFQLAQRFGTTVEAIRLLNNLTTDILEIGQELRIPTEETELPPTYFTYVVQAGDTLWQLAQRFGTTVEAIRLLNNLMTDILSIGQELRIPSDGTVPPAAYFNHTVQPGDTLWSLAQRFGTTVDEIRALNNLTTDQLDIGQVLRIPSEGGVEPMPPSYIIHVVQAGDTLWALAQRFGTTVDAIIELNNLTSDVLEIGQELLIPSEGVEEPEPPSTSFTHVVQAGETLWALAQRFGVTVADIKALNNLTSDVLEIGQVLQIPSTSTPSPSTIVLDAGHGGADPGAVNGPRLEKNDNLNMARAVQQRLLALDQNVIMTRDTDVFIPLEERSAISNRNNADFFISFHRNASSNSAANGLENYVQIGSAPIDIAYAQNVQDEVFGAGVQSNGGVREGNYSVTRNTNAPAMLFELGYITNTIDNQLFDQNFNAYADAITRGIIQSVTQPFPPAAPRPYFNYIVQSGDTLFSIASKFGTTVQAIVALNNLTSNSVALRQILRIPN